MQEQTITLYRQSINLLSKSDDPSPLKNRFLKKRLARALNNLGYHLNRVGQYEEALQAIEQSIALKEQGYAEVDTLADAYGEHSQILLGLGRFQEALFFDEKAIVEVQRLADAGYTFSQEELWIYHVNRGRLYLRLGRVDEAEQLLREALPHIHPKRRMYRMFAKEALEEIERWRQQATSPRHQLDWRWIERYRQLDSFDAYWWWAQAGPFTQQEQRQWDQMFTHTIDDVTKEHLATMLAQSCRREVLAALAQQREPRLHYPALDIEEVRRRIAGMLQLDGQISQQEPNAIVRRLYHEAIEDEVDFLRMFEATYEGNTQRYWQLNRRSEPEPTPQEMQAALLHVRRTLSQGLRSPETVEISQRLMQFVQTQLLLSLDLSSDEAHIQEVLPDEPASLTQPHKLITAQTARRFFERALRECGYEGWQVMIDPKASAPRVEQGLRQLFLQDLPLTIDEIRHFFAHEVAGHVSRFVAGERSPLGLLGMGTKSFLPTEEGLALYQERQVALLHGHHFNDTGTWLGTLATGLASGVVTPAQTFRSLYTFFELFFLLRRLLRQPTIDIQTAQQRAQNVAIGRCLRTYRGVPDLEKGGVCFTKDAVYLRGLWQIERAVAQDPTVLDRLAVGVVALQYLSDMAELGIVSAPQPLKALAYDPALEAYILSCEEEPVDHLTQPT